MQATINCGICPCVLKSDPDKLETVMTVRSDAACAPLKPEDEMLNFFKMNKWPSGFWNQYKTLCQRNFAQSKGRLVNKYIVLVVRKFLWVRKYFHRVDLCCSLHEGKFALRQIHSMFQVGTFQCAMLLSKTLVCAFVVENFHILDKWQSHCYSLAKDLNKSSQAGDTQWCGYPGKMQNKRRYTDCMPLSDRAIQKVQSCVSLMGILSFWLAPAIVMQIFPLEKRRRVGKLNKWISMSSVIGWAISIDGWGWVHRAPGLGRKRTSWLYFLNSAVRKWHTVCISSQFSIHCIVHVNIHGSIHWLNLSYIQYFYISYILSYFAIVQKNASVL